MRLLVPSLALSLTLTVACSPPPSPVDPLAKAQLLPGTALGPVELGRTTLGDFVDTYGYTGVSIVAGDELAMLEISFKSHQLAFMWEFDHQVAFGYSNPSFMQSAHDLGAFLDAHPEARELALHSLSVQAKSTRERSFYRGGIGPNVRLHGPLDSVMGFVEGEMEPGGPSMVAGASEKTPEECYTFSDIGLTVYLERNEAGEPYIQRMTIFQPNSL